MTSFNQDDTFNEFDARYLLREGWRDWTPTVDQGGAVAATVNYARYVVYAQLVIAQCLLTTTGTGTSGNAIIVGALPLSMTVTSDGFVIGSGLIHDLGTAIYKGVVIPASATSVKMRGTDVTAIGNEVGSNPAWALASGNRISFTITYERT